jgi:hypothetical protein
VCVCVRARVCVCVCGRARVRACVCVCGHNIFTEGVLVTPQSSTAGISVWRILWFVANCCFMSVVWLMTNCCFKSVMWCMANCRFTSVLWLCIPLIVTVLYRANQTITGMTICHAFRHYWNIRKICDIFCYHTAEYHEPTPTIFSEFYQNHHFSLRSVCGAAVNAGNLASG